MNNIYRFIVAAIACIVFHFGTCAQQVSVGIFYNQLTETMTFHCTEHRYAIFEDETEILQVGQGDILLVDMEDNKVRLSDQTGVIGHFNSLYFKDLLLKGKFLLKAVSPASAQQLYSGELKIGIQHGVLEIINYVDFDAYIAGVVEAEAGSGTEMEFYKAQSVLCRTYAIKNWERHLNEGFNLCDDTHCQVFHGISDDNPEIINAVLSTHNVVVTDKNYNLITAAYHSNSGGETQEADEIWPGDHDYLLAIIDPFSEDQPNFSWKENLDIEIWKGYLMARGIDPEGFSDNQLMIKQDHRKIYFILEEDSLRIPEIRQDLGFRSAFFNMYLSGDTINIEGKGYGHGIGFSQEGGMKMAKEGFSYEDILHYYYNNVQIRDIYELPESSVPDVFR